MNTDKIVTLEEVRKHGRRGDCWVVVHGHVFDVSKWMQDHPGGWEILETNANGKDNTAEFEEIRVS